MTEEYDGKLQKFLDEVKKEVFRAHEKYGKFRSLHEAYAVILEESDELWDTIRNKQPMERTREEAVQVAAAVLSLLVDLA